MCVFILFLWDAVSCLIFGALLVVCHSENFAALDLRRWASTTKQWSAMLSRSTGKGAPKNRWLYFLGNQRDHTMRALMMLDLSRFHCWEHSLLAVQCYD